MRIFWIIRLWIYSLFMNINGWRGYIGRPIFVKGYSKIYIGRDCRLFPGARLEVLGSGRISFGDHCRVGHNVFMSCTDSTIKIGGNCIFSSNVFMGTQDKMSNFKQKIENSDADWFSEDDEESAIEVGERCFIGINAVLLPGTKLGKACVVGANTTVKGVYDDCSIIACDTSGNYIANLNN